MDYMEKYKELIHKGKEAIITRPKGNELKEFTWRRQKRQGEWSTGHLQT